MTRFRTRSPGGSNTAFSPDDDPFTTTYRMSFRDPRMYSPNNSESSKSPKSPQHDSPPTLQEVGHEGLDCPANTAANSPPNSAGGQAQQRHCSASSMALEEACAVRYSECNDTPRAKARAAAFECNYCAGQDTEKEKEKKVPSTVDGGQDAVVNVISSRDAARCKIEHEGSSRKTYDKPIGVRAGLRFDDYDGNIENPLHLESAVHCTPRLVSILATGNPRNQNFAAEKLIMLVRLHGLPIRKAAHDAGATHLLATLVMMNTCSLGSAGRQTFCLTALADLILWYTPAKQEYIDFCLQRQPNGKDFNLSRLISSLSSEIECTSCNAHRDLLLAMVNLAAEHITAGMKGIYCAKVKASIAECGIIKVLVEALQRQVLLSQDKKTSVPDKQSDASIVEYLKLIRALARLDPTSTYRKLSWQQDLTQRSGRQTGLGGVGGELCCSTTAYPEASTDARFYGSNGLAILLWTAILWCQHNTEVATISLNIVRDAILRKETRRAAVLCISNQRLIECLSENLLALDVAIVPLDVQTNAAYILASIIELEGPALQQSGMVQVFIDVALPRASEILHRSARESQSKDDAESTFEDLHTTCALLVARLIVASNVCCHAVLFHTQILDIVVRTLVRACEYVLAKSVLTASGQYATDPNVSCF
jgi:hypothetical protein